MLVDEASAQTLDSCVWALSSRGFDITYRGEHDAQMIRPKKFSFFWALAWFLLFGVGILVYFAYYLSKNDDKAYITEAADGTVGGTIEHYSVLFGRSKEWIGGVPASVQEERSRQTRIRLSIFGGIVLLIIVASVINSLLG